MARVLVVEDDEVTRGIVTAHLERAGHRVLAVESATEALATIEERGAADVAVLDVGLPDMDGYDLMARLRDHGETASMPVVFLTARIDEADVDRGRRAGARYLTKPFVASALLAHIERALAPSEPRGW